MHLVTPNTCNIKERQQTNCLDTKSCFLCMKALLSVELKFRFFHQFSQPKRGASIYNTPKALFAAQSIPALARSQLLSVV